MTNIVLVQIQWRKPTSVKLMRGTLKRTRTDSKDYGISESEATRPQKIQMKKEK